jgi:hypothetical protein
MSIYTKLNDAREKFHSLKLEKTGENKFAGYKYFELGDFLIPAMKVFKEVGLCAIVSFDKDMARMEITDTDSPMTNSGAMRQFITITSPMGSAALKGCHEVQNIGAVETYQRRYLWVAALEIVEHDALDATTGKDKIVHRPTGDPLVNQARMSIIADVADSIRQHMAGDDAIGAYEEYSGLTDVEERTACWKLLDSKTRAAIKAHGDQLKKEAGFSRA